MFHKKIEVKSYFSKSRKKPQITKSKRGRQLIWLDQPIVKNIFLFPVNFQLCPFKVMYVLCHFLEIAHRWNYLASTALHGFGYESSNLQKTNWGKSYVRLPGLYTNIYQSRNKCLNVCPNLITQWVRHLRVLEELRLENFFIFFKSGVPKFAVARATFVTWWEYKDLH